jgi:radical SAM superfamily enzyme YgiQ (UPF0313 family)
VGLSNVFLGFEKPDQAGLEAVNKRNTVKNNEEALAILRASGIEPNPSFISDPADGPEEFEALRAYVRQLKLKFPYFNVLTPLPGTALFEEMEDHLTTTNYELFDLLHAVTPTRLPLDGFYQEFAQVWRQAYPPWKIQLVRLLMIGRDLLGQRAGTAPVQRSLTDILQHGNVRVYLRDWERFASEPP